MVGKMLYKWSTMVDTVIKILVILIIESAARSTYYTMRLNGSLLSNNYVVQCALAKLSSPELPKY